jgi:outer membrane lipoprotein LolB
MSIKLAAWEEQAAKGLSLGFFFTGNAEQGQLELISLMGSQLAQIGWQSDGAWLINQDGRHDFTDLDALTQQALGEALPLRTLIYWMQGQPDPSVASQPGSEPGLFEQNGWRIDAREQSPKRIQAQRAGNKQQRAIQIKVYLDL